MSTGELEFDVVVIGSGIGGVTAGALLSHKGYRTLVVEKMPFTGGRSGTLPYKGYNLPTGVVMFSDEVHGSVCHEVGAEFEMRPAKNFFTFRLDGKNIESPRHGVFRKLIGAAAETESEAETMNAAFRRAIAWAEPSRSMSLHDWVTQYTLNPKMIAFFDFWVVANTGLRAFELPAGEFFRFFTELAFVKNIGFLPEAGGSFTGALVKAIKRDGGDVWTRARALSIDVEKGMAKGVTVRRGGEVVQVKSRVVVSNAGPRATLDLTGRANLGPGFSKEAESALASAQIMIFVESDRPLLEGAELLSPIDGRRTVCIMADSDISPGTAPPGKHLLEIVAFVTCSTPPYDFRSEVDLALMDARDCIPHFDDHARVLTAQFYHRNWGIMNVWAGHSLPFQTPVEGLYAVGDANGPSGWWGSTAAVKSGRLAADDVVKRWAPAK